MKMKFKKYLTALILSGLVYILGTIFMFTTLLNDYDDTLVSIFGVFMLCGLVAFVPLLILTIKANPTRNKHSDLILAIKKAYPTRNKSRNKSRNKYSDASKWSLVGLITAGVGFLIAFLIFGISSAVYGKVYFFDGYAYVGILWILSAILFVVGLLMFVIPPNALDKIADKIVDKILPLLKRLWNNKIVIIVLSVLVLFISILVLSDEMLLVVIIFEVIFAGGAAAFFSSTKNKINLFRAIFIALLIGFVFGLITCLIFGMELYPNGGCSHCNYKGYFGGNGEKIIDCPKC